MVQTPQGLVAQPIQIQTTPIQTQISNSSIIHGTTPISQIGMSNHISSTNTPIAPASALPNNLDDSDDEDGLGKKKSKRGVLPKQATQIMKTWLFQHIVHPYPTEDEKRQIASQTNLTLLQVNNWFINARRRILQPMLDATNPEPTKKVKSKPQNRPLQRFWPESIANIQPQLPAGMVSTAKIDGSLKSLESLGEQTSPLVVPVVSLSDQSDLKSPKEDSLIDDTDITHIEYSEEDLQDDPSQDPS
ncbi:hypothetical protein FSP39_009807 [Pinctada imbricata]|uniref:Homeobox domain-containing protein n=1 Tax=Pinctada imbricata TaxID=66713 RepID=A0AA88YTR7_PINIB|nr:hypothetical protein FSP39_009807 [Pinctada imbricata]